MKTSLVLGLALVAAAGTLACGGTGQGANAPDSGPNGYGCGVGPIPDYQPSNDAGAGEITDAGVVEFDATELGATVSFTIPVKDSVDESETLLSASFTGPQAAAFAVTSSFPIPVPAGEQVSLKLQFTPMVVGTNSAKLVLQTQDMGVSPIPIQGVGVADGG